MGGDALASGAAAETERAVTPGLELLADEPLRRAVAVAVDDVAVDVHAHGLVVAKLPGLRGGAVEAGASARRRRCRRLPGSFWNSLALSCSSKGAIAALTS